MLDPMIRRRHDFQPGRSLRLADGQGWALPDPHTEPDFDPAYDALIACVVEADRPDDLLRAELALGIHLIAATYDLPPLILGALLDFPQEDPGASHLQDDLHEVAMEHARAYRPVAGRFAEPPPAPRLPRRLGIFGRANASMSA